MTYQKILQSLSTLTEDQLLRLNKVLIGEVKARRKETAKTLKQNFKVGDMVEFDNAGSTLRGVVLKLNPKRAKIRVTNDWRLWVVGYSALRASN